MLLETVRDHNDLVKLNAQQRSELCEEIRHSLVEKVSRTGGHVASNLGVVELTVALETVFDTSVDRLVFDVGHQSYVHKLLTGRQADFDHLRQYGGISGFPKPSESVCDAFTAGHASTSVSVALGMARARSLRGEDYHVVALIGDGAATGGVAFEGLNDAAVSGEPMIVVLNDNAMSIDKNVGGMARHLSKLRSKARYLGLKERSKRALSRSRSGRAFTRLIRRAKAALHRLLLPPTIFESMGFAYIGPLDGHNTEELISVLSVAKTMKKPVIVHVMTKKGKGYVYARKNPRLFHGIGKFDPQTGEPEKASAPGFSATFGETLVSLAEQDSRVCAITAAMPAGTGLLEFKDRFPDRTFDVGIAEEHAVSMAGGLAKQGMVPVVAIYSTFLQRAYDMMIQDVCLQGLHVVFAVDRAGLVGEDGETHHGVFDMGILCDMPGLTVLCPASREELGEMLRWAVETANGPVAVRYPRGGGCDCFPDIVQDGDVAIHRKGRDVTLITYGTYVSALMTAAVLLQEAGIEATVLRLKTASPLSPEAVAKCLAEGDHVFILEEVCNRCGIGCKLARDLEEISPSHRFHTRDLGSKFVTHGDTDSLYRHCHMDPDSVAAYVREVLNGEE